MPEIPTPPSTTDPNSTTPSGTDPSGTDPSGTDPDGPGGPNQPGGPDNPGIPTSPTTDQEETVTIKDGDHEISVTSPDGQGVVKVTVDDGSGHPKTYTLDFGGPDPATPSPLAQPGQAEFGPNGAPRIAAPDTPIEPGPDGRCTITDGDLTITAERPEGQPDTVVVTVDDGTGEPTTYNLDYSEANTEPGDVRTLPAPGGMPQELVDANRQVDEADFTPAGANQPAFGEVPQTLQAEQAGTQPAFGEAPQFQAEQVGTQPAFGEVPQSFQAEQVGAQSGSGDGPPVQSHPATSGEQQHAFATTASAANDPAMSGLNGGAHSPGGEVGSGWFGSQDQAPSPYMHGSSGEAGLPSVPDSSPDSPAAPDEAHPGMAGGGGGMPMMGGAPGGGGTGGDGDRAVGQWRTTGDLFDEPIDPQQLRNAFGGEDR